MTTIIAGSFEQQDAAQRAASELADAGFPPAQTSRFFVNAPGQHDLHPLGGDVDESPGTEDAAGGSAAGVAVGGGVGVAVGLATLPVLGPGAAVAAAGVGAYVGSLYGALGNSDDKTDPAKPPDHAAPRRREAPPRKSGMLVAVCAPAAEQADTAMRILRAHGATDLERSEGTIVAGDWTDFNPLTPPQLVAN